MYPSFLFQVCRKKTSLRSLQTFSCNLTLRGHQGPVMSVAFNADATVLATASYDRTAKLWRVEDGVCLQTIAGHRILAQDNI